MQLLDIPLINWLNFLLINMSLLISSYCVSSYMTQRSAFSATLCSTLMFYLAQAMVIILAFGVLFKSFNVLMLEVLTLSISCLQIVYFRRHRKPFIKLLVSGFKGILSCRDIWLYIIVSFVILQVLINLGKVFILPVHIFDSLVYRAPPAPYWFQLGMIPNELNVPVNDMNGKALGIAVMMLWYFLFLGDSIFANLPEFVISIILLLVVYSAARQCKATQPWSLKLATLAYFMPGVLIESVSTQDHLAVNVMFVSILFLIRELSIRRDIKIIPLIGIAVGLMLSFKINAIIYFPIILVACLYWIWKRCNSILKKAYKPHRIVASLAIALLFTFSVGGYWITKNIIVYNDIFGVSFNTMQFGDLSKTLKSTKADNGTNLFDSHSRNETNNVSQNYQATNFFKISNLMNNLRLLPSRLIDGGLKEKSYAGNFRNISAFGPQFFSMGILTLVFFLYSIFFKQYRINGSFYVVTGLAMLLLYFFIMDNPYAYRNFLFLPFCVFIYSAALFSYLNIERSQITATLLNLTILISIIWSALHLLPPMHANQSSLKEFVSLERHYQSPARYNRNYTFSPNVYRILDELPRNEPVFYVNGQRRNTWVYNYFDVKWQRPVEYIPLLEKYFQCSSRNSCSPTDAFKHLLKEKSGHIVNFCVAIRCLKIIDPQFFEITPGLYYFNGNESDK